MSQVWVAATQEEVDMGAPAYYEDCSLEGVTIEDLEAMGYTVEAVNEDQIYVTF